jgi:hypothetical protein
METGSTYGPETLKALDQAFDEAWLSIEANFNEDPRTIENARLKLARAIFSVASDDRRDVETLKAGALAAMALAYRG